MSRAASECMKIGITSNVNEDRREEAFGVVLDGLTIESLSINLIPSIIPIRPVAFHNFRSGNKCSIDALPRIIVLEDR